MKSEQHDNDASFRLTDDLTGADVPAGMDRRVFMMCTAVIDRDLRRGDGDHGVFVAIGRMPPDRRRASSSTDAAHRAGLPAVRLRS